jgi:hypothetical protein
MLVEYQAVFGDNGWPAKYVNGTFLALRVRAQRRGTARRWVIRACATLETPVNRSSKMSMSRKKEMMPMRGPNHHLPYNNERLKYNML